ncbi:hypothetical protein [Chryseobacterium polytrichastri]|uniref:Uncharacterized protein n=1 Tax=Chryseobacterium polytrichastri TaxID=1302687 RepID=A0A1M7AEY2_9FLAO|nr:hypothetical protein [Chryseobacterium polytrichastri]SHL41298.1 hypothetical protein SAMN05444267_101770 [Chryseobacterium polytrichastri]
MDINFKLDFFYYDELFVLDGIDPKTTELKPHIDKFKSFITTKPLDKVVELLIFSYKEKYAQNHFWTMNLLIEDSYKIEDKYPSYLDEKTDIYLSSKKINRIDFEHLICKLKFDTDKGCCFSEYMEFSFKQQQNINKFKEAVEKSLNGKQYQIIQSNDNLTFKVENSPIALVEITGKKVKITINPDKWIAYYGLG